jgi:exodeoxyribonuclease V
MSAIVLNDGQEEVLEQLLDWLDKKPTNYATVGGFAGTGKTTLIAYLRRVLIDSEPDIKKVAFCSFTGKAASVLRQKLQEADSMQAGDTCGTIHSLIYKAVTDEAGQIINWDRVNSLNTDLIIIDEGSMVNESIWRDIVGYRKPIIVFGDHGQLPPIESGFNLLEKPDFTLETIVRQAADNPIIRLSQAIRQGKNIPFGSYYGMVHKLPLQSDEARERFESLVTDKEEDYLCLCGRNKTRVMLNKQIRDLKGRGEENPQKGDRVICLKNNYTKMIFNGMLGKIEKIEPEKEHWYKVKITIDDGLGAYKGTILRHQFNALKTLRGGEGSDVPIPEKEFGDLFDFGYCITAHKAQGSEAKRVIVFEERMFNYTDDMWARWLYTAVTRAKEELYIFA